MTEEVATHLGKRVYSVWIEDGLEANDYYLTLEEANEFIKYYEFDSFEWHGQMYDVK